ncbi:MAG: O-antigen/teichoic acid export membrane protein [Planctomycetota bacterium]|jgi:O-antigen/teichoic acid export membrane protein
MVKAKIGNLLLLGFGEVATRGFSFLAFSYLGHVLAPEDLGIYGSALAVMMFGALTLDQGFGIHGSRGIARHPASTEVLVRQIVSVQLWLAVAIYAVIWVTSKLAPIDPTLGVLLRGLGLTLFAAPFFFNWVFQGRNEMLWYALPTAIRQLTFLLLVLLLVKTADDLKLLPYAEIGGAVICALCFVVAYVRSGSKLVIDLRAGWNRQLFKEALPIGGSNLIWALRTYLPILVVLGALGPKSAGFFEPGHRIIMVLFAFLGVYFTNIFPAMSSAAIHDRARLRILIRKALATSIVGTVVMATASSLTAEFAINLVVGSQYVTEAAVNSMIILSWILPIVAWRRCAMFGLIVLDQQKKELRCSIVGLVVLVAIIYPLTKEYGLAGCASSMLISEFLATMLTWYYYREVDRRL